MGSPLGKPAESKTETWKKMPSIESVNLARQIAQGGYVPYQGGEVAAFSPQMTQGMQGSQDMWSAFNNPGGTVPQVAASIPEAQDFGGGLKGYSGYGGYQDQLANLQQSYPGLASYLRQFTIDPRTGTLPTNNSWGNTGTIGTDDWQGPYGGNANVSSTNPTPPRYRNRDDYTNGRTSGGAPGGKNNR